MKTLNWNLGIIIIRIGYKIRGEQRSERTFKIHEAIGRAILQFGYWLRGEIPMKTWKRVKLA